MSPARAALQLPVPQHPQEMPSQLCWWPCVMSSAWAGPGRAAPHTWSGRPRPASTSCPPSTLHLLDFAVEGAALVICCLAASLSLSPGPGRHDRSPWPPFPPQAWWGLRGRQGDHAAPILRQHRVAGCVREEGAWGCAPASSPAHLHLLIPADPHLLTPTHICPHPHPHEEAFEDCGSMLPAHVVLCFLLSAGPRSSRPWPMLAVWLTDPGGWSLGMLGVSPQAHFHPVGSAPFLCRLHAASWTSVPETGLPDPAPFQPGSCLLRALVPTLTQDPAC